MTKVTAVASRARKTCVMFAAVAGLLVAAAPAAAAPVYWKPAQAADTVRHTNLMHTVDGRFMSAGIVHTATCKGIGRPVKHAYRTLRCTVTAGSTLASAPFTVWVKPAARACITTIGLAVCTVPLSRNDPRVCPTSLNRDACLYASASLAYRTHLGGGSPGRYQGELACVPAGPFRFLCSNTSDASNGEPITWTASTDWVVGA